MSLVAGYDSESADDSDTDESSQVSSKQTEKVEQFHIEDEDQWRSMSNDGENKLFSFLPQPKCKKDEVVEEIDDEFIRKKPVAFSEDNVVKQSKVALNLPKPSKNFSKKKHPVKISIPTFAEIGGESDSDDDEKIKSKPDINKKGSTLFSLLPKPRHSVTVGNNKNRVFLKQVNRSLIPHTLTKKKDQIKIPKSISKTVMQSDDDDDDKEEMSSVNFFSLSGSTGESGNIDSSSSGAKEALVVNTCSQEDKVKSLPDVKKIKTSANSPQITLTNSSQLTTTSSDTNNKKDNSYFATLIKSNTSINNHINASETVVNLNKRGSKVGVKSNTDKIYDSVTTPYSSVTEPYGKVKGTYSNVTTPYSSVTEPYGGVTEPYGSATYGNVGSSQTSSHGYPSKGFFSYSYKSDPSLEEQKEVSKEAVYTDFYNRPNEDLPLDKEALKALQGSKRRREEIKIIDINAKDIQGSSDDYLKNLTKETAYKAKKPTNDEPNRQQKNKHQITYLAFQAKEREFELRQAWADGRASKQQTQNKYGF